MKVDHQESKKKDNFLRIAPGGVVFFIVLTFKGFMGVFLAAVECQLVCCVWLYSLLSHAAVT